MDLKSAIAEQYLAKSVPVTAKTVFSLTCYDKTTPEVMVPVVAIAESGEKAIQMLTEREPNAEVVSVVSAHELMVLLATLREVARGEIKPFVMQDGFTAADIF